ncbi:MAG TPA: DNA polymerase III subunit delta [Phycisphaerae bacterium]|nr:DNA polymerase III subunit delta [Phycisphaerae bacterium]
MPDQPPKPVYVLHGTDGYLRRRCRADLLRRLLGPEEQDLAVTEFDADAELSEVLDELRTAPLLAGRRVVVIRDADAFVQRYRGKLKEYLEAPSRNGSLILIVATWDARAHLTKRVAEIGETFDCSSPPASRLPGWIAKASKERGKPITPDAAKALAAWVGADLAALDSEIEKLCLYAADRAEVTAEDVAAVVVASAGPEPFALTNAIEAGDRRGALEALGAMMTVRGEEFRALGMIGWMLRSALSGQSGYRGRRPPASPTAVVRKFRHALRADLAMKSGANPLTTMQLLVSNLCR